MKKIGLELRLSIYPGHKKDKTKQKQRYSVTKRHYVFQNMNETALIQAPDSPEKETTHIADHRATKSGLHNVNYLPKPQSMNTAGVGCSRLPWGYLPFLPSVYLPFSSLV